ncbi:MAG: transposase [Deltaproteobacteria bacterium]|nr:transposase [Deltaproteobacteria bacterium]
MTTLGRRCVETWEVIPGKVVRHRRWDETVACPRCDRIVCAKAPPSVLDGGKLGPVLVTEALCNKVLNGMPIERQARDFQRQGVPIAASTLGRSVAAVLALLVPVARRILVRIKDSERVQLDATGLRVLDRKAALGVFRDTLWALIGDRRWVYFEALESGDADAIEALLQGADSRQLPVRRHRDAQLRREEMEAPPTGLPRPWTQAAGPSSAGRGPARDGGLAALRATLRHREAGHP